jgi:hypothetical protein
MAGNFGVGTGAVPAADIEISRAASSSLRIGSTTNTGNTVKLEFYGNATQRGKIEAADNANQLNFYAGATKFLDSTSTTSNFYTNITTTGSFRANGTVDIGSYTVGNAVGEEGTWPGPAAGTLLDTLNIGGAGLAGTIWHNSAGSLRYWDGSAPQTLATGASGSFVLKAGDTMSGKLQINVATTTTEGLVVKTTDNNATKNLTEWQNAAGTATAWISADGKYHGDGSALTNISASSYSSDASRNTKAGTTAGAAISTGTDNSFYGYEAGLVNSSGNFNTFYGSEAGKGYSTGSSNTMIGYNTGIGAATASGNTFVGAQAGKFATGANNTIMGEGAAGAGFSGTENTMVGQQAGTSTTSGNHNSFFGKSSGLANSTGTGNTFLGRGSGLTNTTGSNNTVIGYAADVGTNNLSNASAIGYMASVTASNSMVLGGTGAQAVNVGINNTAPGAKLQIDAPTTTAKGLIVKTTDDNVTNKISEWQSSTGTAIYSLHSNGTPTDATDLITRGYSTAASTGYVLKTGDTMSGALAITSADGVNSASAIQTITNNDVTAGESQGLLIKAGNGATDYPLRVQDRTAATEFFAVRGDGNVGIGTTSPGAKLTVSSNVGAIPAPFAGTNAHFASADGTNFRMLLDSYGATPVLMFRQSAGTAAAPSATQVNGNIGAIVGLGYGATGYTAARKVGTLFWASENWNDTANGTYMTFETTPNGSLGEAGRFCRCYDLRDRYE